LTDRAQMSKRTDYDLYNVISQGGPAVGRSTTMPAWNSVLSPQEMWDLVAYIRQLSKAP
jgi:mono/diheme cytochrome c family protein